MTTSYWYKRGLIVYWKPIYGNGFVGESWVIAKPGDKNYEELAKSTTKMLPQSMEAIAEILVKS